MDAYKEERLLDKNFEDEVRKLDTKSGNIGQFTKDDRETIKTGKSANYDQNLSFSLTTNTYF